MATERRSAKLSEVLRQRQPDLTVVMENIHDPHNVSAMLRSCDAAGVVQVQLVYTKEEFPSIGKKSSASAAKWIDQRKFRTAQECVETLRAEGFTVLATHMAARSVSLFELDLTRKVALVFGNEHRGVSDEFAELADSNFLIPMHGMIQSLNVSVACAVTLYEAVRQRERQGGYSGSKLSEDQLKALLKQWKGSSK